MSSASLQQLVCDICLGRSIFFFLNCHVAGLDIHWSHTFSITALNLIHYRDKVKLKQNLCLNSICYMFVLLCTYLTFIKI